MAKITANFSAPGTGNHLPVQRDNDFTATVAGTFTGTVLLEASETAGTSWDLVKTFTAPGADTIKAEPSGGSQILYRFRATTVASGTINTTLEDVPAVVVGGGKAILAWGGRCGNNNQSPVRFSGGLTGPGAHGDHQSRIRAPFAGTLRNLFIHRKSAVGAGNESEYEVFTYPGGTATASGIKGTLAVGETEKTDVANTVAIAKGDDIEIRTKANSGTPAAEETNFTLELTPS